MALVAPRQALAERIELMGIRLVRIVAPAGWGKSTLARMLADRHPGAQFHEFSEAETPEAWEAAIDGMIAARPAFIVLDDIHVVLRYTGGVDRVRRLFRGLSATARIVVTSRDALPAELLRGFAPHETVAISIDELALDDATRKAIIGQYGSDATVVERAASMTRGWPIAVFLFARFAREGRLAELIARDGSAPYDDLYAYIEREVLDDLSDVERRVVAAAIVLGEATAAELSAVVGVPAGPIADALVAGRLVLRQSDERFRPSPMAITLFNRSARDLVAEVSRIAAEAATLRRDHVRGAELWLSGGDPVRAALCLDRAGWPERPNDRRYLRVAEAIPLLVLARSETAFDALYGSPRLRGRPWEPFERARGAVDGLAVDAEPRLRGTLRLALGILYRFIARFREADTVLELAAADSDSLPPHRVRLLEANRAAVAAVRGRTHEARTRWTAAGLDDDPDAFRSERLELELAIGLMRGDREAVLAAGAAVLEDARLSGDTYEIAYGAMLRVMTLRLTGDRRPTAEALNEIALTSSLDPLDPLSLPYLRPTDVAPEQLTRWTSFTLSDAAFDQDDFATARRLLELSIDGFDRVGMPHYQVGTRILASFVPGAGRARLVRQARDIAKEIDEPLFAESLEEILAGKTPERGPFRGMLARIEVSRLLRGTRALRLEVLRGRVVRAGEEVPLRAREMELLAALAFSRGSLSSESILERLWSGGNEGAGPSALRMSVLRLRRQLGDADAVVSTADGYALGESVATDLEEIEGVVPALARLPSLTDSERARLAAVFERLAVELPERVLRWEWLGPELARFDEYRHTAGMLLGDDALASNRPLDALAIGETLLKFEPLDEPATELVVRALIAARRRAEAARRIRRYRERLADELGATPAIDLERHLTKGS